jgi:hypothetical protein
MTLHAFDHKAIPEETVRVAKAAFPKGNVYLKMLADTSLQVSGPGTNDLI